MFFGMRLKLLVSCPCLNSNYTAIVTQLSSLYSGTHVSYKKSLVVPAKKLLVNLPAIACSLGKPHVRLEYTGR